MLYFSSTFDVWLEVVGEDGIVVDDFRTKTSPNEQDAKRKIIPNISDRVNILFFILSPPFYSLSLM